MSKVDFLIDFLIFMIQYLSQFLLKFNEHNLNLFLNYILVQKDYFYFIIVNLKLNLIKNIFSSLRIFLLDDLLVIVIFKII